MGDQEVAKAAELRVPSAGIPGWSAASLWDGRAAEFAEADRKAAK